MDNDFPNLVWEVLSANTGTSSEPNASFSDQIDESNLPMDRQIVANALARARQAHETPAEENPTGVNPTDAHLTGANPAQGTQSDAVDLTAQGEEEEERGFATDSSPIISESGSSDSDSDSDSNSAKSYTSDIDFIAQELLNRSQALDLEADADDGEGPSATNPDTAPRTRNEVDNMVLPRPDIVITHDMNLKLLGSVHTLVNSIVTIRATGNTNQFPDVGTPLCLDNGTVLAALSDTFGTAQNLFHIMGFQTIEELKALGLKPGTLIYFPERFAQLAPVDRSKGYDTSNIYDEEIEDGSDFTDDEAERAHKKQKAGQSDRRGGRSGRSGRDARPKPSPSMYQPRSSVAPDSLRYDDGDAGNDDGPYNPLRRPTDLGQARSAPRGGRHGSWDARPGSSDRPQGFPSSFAPRGTPADNSNRDTRDNRARDDYRRDHRDDHRRDYRDDHRRDQDRRGDDRDHRSGPGSSLRGPRDNRDDRDRDYRGDHTERRDYDNRRDYNSHGQRDGHGGSYGAFSTGYNTGASTGRSGSFGAPFFPQPTPPNSAQFGVGPPPPPPTQPGMGYNWAQMHPSQATANTFGVAPQPSAVGFMNAGFTNVPPPPPGFVGTPTPPVGLFNFSAAAQAQAPNLAAGTQGVPNFTGATATASAPATSTATPNYPYQFNAPPPGYGQSQNGQDNRNGQGNHNGQNRG